MDTVEMVKKTITCDICGEKYEYEESKDPLSIDPDGTEVRSAEDLPDGYLVDGLWICDSCGSCPNCGKTLEKEREKRAHMENGELIPAKACNDCGTCPSCGTYDSDEATSIADHGVCHDCHRQILAGERCSGCHELGHSIENCPLNV